MIIRNREKSPVKVFLVSKFGQLYLPVPQTARLLILPKPDFITTPLCRWDLGWVGSEKVSTPLRLSPLSAGSQGSLPSFSSLGRFVGKLGNTFCPVFVLLAFGSRCGFHGLPCAYPPCPPVIMTHRWSVYPYQGSAALGRASECCDGLR